MVSKVGDIILPSLTIELYASARWSGLIRNLPLSVSCIFQKVKQLVKIDRVFASSKLCNHCSTKNIMLTLSDIEWKCSKCNSNHDRDINASLNIRDEGMRLLGLEITAWDSGKSLPSN
jgi:ribosomal protein S27AE